MASSILTMAVPRIGYRVRTDKSLLTHQFDSLELQQQDIEEGEAEQGDAEDAVCGEEGGVESLQSMPDEKEVLVHQEG